MNRALTSITGVSVALIVAACSSSPTAPPTDGAIGGDSGNQTGNGGAKATGSSKTTSGGNKSTTSKTTKGGNTATSEGNEGGASDGGESSGEGGASTSSKTSSGSTKGGTSGSSKSSAAVGGTKASSSGDGGTSAEGGAATGGTSAVDTTPVITDPVVVTSAPNAYWKTDVELTEAESGNAEVTVNDTSEKQTWEGWGGSFNEMGWSYLTTDALKEEALKLLFGKDGAHITWGRIPMGASDYALIRYTVDDPAGTDPAVNGETARPALDPTLAKFSLSRDEKYLIPYIKAAQEIKPNLKFWASPWTAPISMKTGYKGSKNASDAKKPSYFDGGYMKGDETTLKAYAELFKKFVEGYKAKEINIEIVSPQNEPGYEQNYPSCLWESKPYVDFIGKHLGPAMKELGVKVMLGTMSNAGDKVDEVVRNDLDIANAVLGDSTAKGFVSVGGVQWGVLGRINGGATMGNLPIWATEHKCGNYPWTIDGFPTYDPSKPAPNDQAYAVESWGYMRDALTKGKVTSYSAWNMVLDKNGLGNDTTRDWRQNALLVADGGKITKTPFYHVFRHLSQYAQPGGKIVGTTGGDAVAFKNPDGSLVAVMYNSGAAKTSIIAIGGKKYSFAMPGSGWATVVVPKA